MSGGAETDGPVQVHVGDCRAVMAGMDAASVDAVVTDPPYHLTSIVRRFGADDAAPAQASGATGVYGRASAGFMGQTWDGGDIAFDPATWAAVRRVMKPGAHLAAFGGTRTFHRMVMAIEAAGFEIRDQLIWMYGSGFPKSHSQSGDWEGWGTALKPAHEPICLARVPLIGTVAANLAAHGTGALHVDACRIGAELAGWKGAAAGGRTWNDANMGLGKGGEPRPTTGRWPANLCHDGSAAVAGLFPQGKSTNGRPLRSRRPGGGWGMTATGAEYDDQGSAARYFYCAKASRDDRDDGLDHMPKGAAGIRSETRGQHITRRDPGYEVAPRANIHPTVKPTALMQWLCRLITPPGGVVLDPFMGSGSTGRGAVMEGFRFTGIEQDAHYAAIARARIDASRRRVAAQGIPGPDLFAGTDA
ncbi:MAG: DNA methyltransferase [Minwuia sp.]|nr:DNA methyltransferase [Minwuia sp.]